MACGMDHKGLKGVFWMVACWAAPLGIGLGGRTASLGQHTHRACLSSQHDADAVDDADTGGGRPAIHSGTVHIRITRGQYGTSNTRCQPP